MIRISIWFCNLLGIVTTVFWWPYNQSSDWPSICRCFFIISWRFKIILILVLSCRVGGQSNVNDFKLAAEACLPIICGILAEIKKKTYPQNCFLNMDVPTDVVNHKVLSWLVLATLSSCYDKVLKPLGFGRFFSTSCMKYWTMLCFWTNVVMTFILLLYDEWWVLLLCGLASLLSYLSLTVFL